MPVFFHPEDGQPVFVLEGRENDFLKLGYRTTEPQLIKVIPPVAVAPVVENNPPTPIPATPNTNQVLINSASLKELTEKFNLSTAQAKEVRDKRNYADIEELIAKVPAVNWTGLNSQISYAI